MTRWFFVALITAFAAISGPRVTNIGTVVALESHNLAVPSGGGDCPAHAPCPLPPRAFVDTTYSLPIGGKTWAVHSDADFIAALAGFAAGDVIALDAGKIYTGNCNAQFTVPMKPNPTRKWTYITTSAYSSLPVPGTRVAPGDAGKMPKIATSDTCASLNFAPGANYVRLVGLELTSNSTRGGDPSANPPQNNFSYYLIQTNGGALGAPLVNNVTYDRIYAHGSDTQDVIHAVDIDGSHLALIDSYVSDIHMQGQDAQGVLGLSLSSGPYKITNNFIEASTENVFFSPMDGTGNRSNPFNPADIEIRNNWLYKPTAWDKCGVKGTVTPGEKTPDGSLCASNNAYIGSSSWAHGVETLRLDSSDIFSAGESVEVYKRGDILLGTFTLTAASGTPTNSVRFNLAADPGSLASGHVSAAVSGASWSSGKVTLNIGNASTNWHVGTFPSEIFVAGCSLPGYNGAHVVTAVTANSLSYAVTSNPGPSPTGCTGVGVVNQWVVKNSLEFKTGQRAVITGNLLENNWLSGQVGWSLLLTNRSQDATNLYISDILFQNNTIKNSDRGINTLYQDPVQGYTWRGYNKRVWINNNLILLSTNLDVTHFGMLLDGGSHVPGYGNTDGLTDYVIQHNTIAKIDGSALDQSLYFALPYLPSCLAIPPGFSSTHNVWILDNVMTQQLGGDCGFIGNSGLKIYMRDPEPYSSRFIGNVIYCQGGGCAPSGYPPRNHATKTPFTFNSGYCLTVPNWAANTSDGERAGWRCLD